MVEGRWAMSRFRAALGFAMMVLLSSASSASSVPWRARVDVPIDDYLTPAEYPCLVETIHVTGTLESRFQCIINPVNGFSVQEWYLYRGMTATGLTTGTDYSYRGAAHWTSTGTTDEPWITFYPREWTFTNTVHLIGPGDDPNIYYRKHFHFTVDPETGEVKVEVFREDVVCR